MTEEKKLTPAQLWKRRERIQAKIAELNVELKEIDAKLRSELDNEAN